MTDRRASASLQRYQIVDMIERRAGEWLPGSPERRRAQVKFGLVEVVAPWLIAGREAIIPLGRPIVEAWGSRYRGRRQRAAGAGDAAVGSATVMEQGGLT